MMGGGGGGGGGGVRANTCAICNKVSHSTSFCPSRLSSGSHYSPNLPASSAKKFNTVPICIFSMQLAVKGISVCLYICVKFVNLIHIDLRLVQSKHNIFLYR